MLKLPRLRRLLIPNSELLTMTLEKIICILVWLYTILNSTAKRGAFADLEDASGCNGDVLVSIDENGWIVLSGPFREPLIVQNWRLDETVNC